MLAQIGAGLTAGLGSGLLGMWGQSQANKANAKMAQQQMDFQERMSNSAYQRTMDDMKKAGLNPMLAYQQGGASTPSGATATMQSTTGELASAMEAGVSSALDARRLKKEIAAVDSQTAVNEATVKTQETLQALNATNAKRNILENSALEARIPAIKAQAKADQRAAVYNERFADVDAFNQRINQGLGTLNNAKNLITPKIQIETGIPKGRPGDLLMNRKGEIRHEYR